MPPKKKPEPMQPMRPLHWVKLPDAKVVGTIWVDADQSGGIGTDDNEAGLDRDAIEVIFGLGEERDRSASRSRATSVGTDPSKAKKREAVQLIDTKRSNNVAIALSRIRLSDEAIKAAVLDPVANQLSPDQVNALLVVIPTAEEIETIKEYSGDRESLGRVETFFLVLSDVERLGPRLQALQALHQFGPGWETLSDELKTVMTAAEQVHTSPALKSTLLRVLAIGNYLNGISARGGAYGFKVADLSKLVQVKSADSKTTLLHYLAKFIDANSSTAIDDLKAQLNALPEAKDIAMADKKGELAKLVASLKAAQNLLDTQGGSAENDPIVPLLTNFVAEASKKLEQLQADCAATEAKLKELALWLAERASASTSDLFAPLAEFVKSLDKAQQDNVREAEAERRRAMATKGTPAAAGGRRLTGMASPFGPAGGDKNMMLEMQLKLAQRTEKAAGGAGASTSAIKQQQQQLLAKQLATNSTKSTDGNLVDDLAGGALSGTLFAQRRAAAALAASGKGT